MLLLGYKPSRIVRCYLVTLTCAKVGRIAGCRTPHLEIPMRLKVLKPSRPQITDKWTDYRGDARCLNPS